MKESIMVIAAHADDEALGCGGTMARLTAAGAQIHVVFMADGVFSRKSSTKNQQKKRKAAAKAAQKILGSKNSHFLEMPDNQMDQVPMLLIVQSLEALIKKYQPKTIFTHFHGDLNVDHRITQQAVMTACRPVPGCPVKKIYGFEVPSSTEWATPGEAPFCPTFFVDIGSFLQIRLRALQAYSMEMRGKPHARSVHHVKALARHRGNSVGVEAAEAFVVYRHIE
jgi:LmbE family N-acetylglucosaminyl deacetylase